jgi:hypothetical protein
MRPLDFTLEKYRQLCLALIDSEYTAMTVRDYLLMPPPRDSRIVILRHDVDRKPEKAARMAVLENRLGLSSTYYFRATRSVFKPEVIKGIDRLGHEIGYHYETLARAKGEHGKALRLFREELLAFRKVVDVRTICMHGSPMSRWDNRSLWENHDFGMFDLVGEAYLSIDYSDLVYLTDTGRSWNADRRNVRDRVFSMKGYAVRTTDELIELIRTEKVGKMCIQTHPERWDHRLSAWILSQARDQCFNLAKYILSFATPFKTTSLKDN